ncbi:CBS domain-containing protein [Oricola indica]|uniref:CBS domain-containing protein n=1 Tax=Oricola indica TaxID=2872591 RepID=UPI003CCC0E3A
MISKTLIETAGNRLVTVDRSARLIAAAQAFDHAQTRLIVVLGAGGAIVGVVSRTDIVSRISRCTGCSCTEAVETAMTADVKTCAPSEPVEEVWSRMKQTGFMHMPVIDAARHPLGVMTARDILEALLDEREHEESLLMDYVMGIGYR